MRNYLDQTILRPGFLASLFSLAVITLLGLATLFTMNPTCAFQPFSSSQETVVQQESEQSATESITESEREWRYTRFGWQDANNWPQPEQASIFRSIQSVHPSLWAADVVLASLGALIWATDDEHQVARLLGRVNDDEDHTDVA